jgi:hypothetical protein
MERPMARMLRRGLICALAIVFGGCAGTNDDFCYT